jgi:LuxR family maltose regulon positive regulatory protein
VEQSTQRAPDEREGSDSVPHLVHSFPLVEAKLHPPAPRPGTIPRERLVRLLMAEPRPSVVSIIAPPGYGKTVLLAEWAAREERPVAWLTLDDLDNDPSVFLSYVAAAVDRIEPIDGAIASALATPGPRILATAVPHLAHALHAIGRPAILVLDDVHRLVDRTCLDALAALLDHLPPGFQVAIAARTEPDLPFARFRAERDLLEIRRSELALDQGETEALTAAAGHPLTSLDARVLTERTEGWAVGVYLATLATLSGGAGGAGAVERVSGRDPYIAEYLRSELWPGLDDDDVALLTRTSILEVVEPRVAEAVSGLPGAAERLRSLARANQFITQVAGAGVSYRYHHLFRDFLQAELARREPAAAPELHRRAASWYAAAGSMDRAVEHAIRSGDIDAAAALVTAAALPTFYGGHPATVDRWLQGFGDATFARHPPLAVWAAWIHALNGRPEEAGRMADIADHSTFVGAPGDGSASFESQRAILRAVMGRHGAEDVLANATFAVSAEEPASPWRSDAVWMLGSAHMLHGDLATADVEFADAVDAAAVTGASAMLPLAKRATVSMARGDWKAAEDFAWESHAVLSRANLDQIAPSLLVHAVAARVAIHRGDLARGREELVHAQLVRPLTSYALPWHAVDALLELARAYQAISDPAGARSVVREAEEIARRRPGLGVLASDLVEMRLRLGDASGTLPGSSSLTAAELRLLPVLSTHLSFQEIGDRLHLSRNTVKTQALSIYGKLQASGRSQAVERAVELGLLEPYPGLALTRRPSTD